MAKMRCIFASPPQPAAYYESLMDRFKAGGQMRLFAAFLVAGMAAAGTAQASSLVFVPDSKTSPSLVEVGAPKVAVSVVALGTSAIDTNNVAAIAATSTPRMRQDVMVIRSGEIGDASADPAPVAQPAQASAAPAQQQAAADAQPVPASTNEPAATPAQDLVH